MIRKCCAQPDGSKGCATGPHVFYEKDPALLHARHPFSSSAESCTGPDGQGALDICAIDCEMVYTTAGSSVARVSIVDNKGNEVLDSFVRLTDGVDLMLVLSLPHG
jgi:RNA exonuclease 1